MTTQNKITFAVCIIAVALLITNSAFATNGMNMISPGARMSAMGGASQGLMGDPHLMNANPAGIASMTGHNLGLGIGLLMPGVHFMNSLNDEDADAAIFPIPSFSYVMGSEDCKWTYGLGFYAQGGMGATYPELKHNIFRAFDNDPRTQDAYVTQEYHSSIAYLKVTPTVAYQLTNQLSAGLALNVGYSMLEMSMPYSIDPMEKMVGQVPGMGGMTFGQLFGGPSASGGLGYDEVTAMADLGDGVTATGFGAKLGFQYKVNEQLTFGLTYTSSSTLTFSGDAVMDMNSQFGDAYERMVAGALMQMGANPATASDAEVQAAQMGVNTNLGNMGIDMMQGMVSNYDAEIEFSWPQEFGFGAAYVVNEKLLVAADFKWINWKVAMEKFAMDFSQGDNVNINAMMGSPDINLEMPMNWEDQITFGLGAEYMATEALALRFGFNYGADPVPENTVIPIFPAVVESHITLGFGYQLTEKVGIDFGYELVLPTELESVDSIIANEYDGSTSELKENVIHLSATIRF